MSNSIQNPGSIGGAASQLATMRPRYQFTIPEKARQWQSDPTTVVLREISVAEETRAAEVAGGLGFKFAYECLKASVESADGQPVTWEAGAKERFLDGCSPKVRDLLMKAYSRIHAVQKDDDESFFGSMATIA